MGPIACSLMFVSRWRRASFIASMLTSLAIIGGCAATPSSTLEKATRAYNAQDNAQAVRLARLACDEAQGLTRQRARYLLGLALLQEEQNAAAADALRDATDASDRTLAADARVSLGTALCRLGETAQAAEAYRRAALLLDGAEAVRAHSIAARCFDAAGLSKVAEEERVAAGEPRELRSVSNNVSVMATPSNTTIAPVKPTANEVAPQPIAATTKSPTARVINGMEIEPIHFAIQAGAYRDRLRAVEVAAELAAQSTSAHLGAPRVVSKPRSDGSTVFVVQIGDFPNRTLAGKSLLGFARSGFTVERFLQE